MTISVVVQRSVESVGRSARGLAHRSARHIGSEAVVEARRVERRGLGGGCSSECRRSRNHKRAEFLSEGSMSSGIGL
jgi:hypothetical protein